MSEVLSILKIPPMVAVALLAVGAILGYYGGRIGEIEDVTATTAYHMGALDTLAAGFSLADTRLWERIERAEAVANAAAVKVEILGARVDR